MSIHWVLAHLAARSPALSHVLEGRAVRLGQDGGLDSRRLVRHAVSEADINEALRAASLEQPSGARLVVLEASGKISVLKQQ